MTSPPTVKTFTKGFQLIRFNPIGRAKTLEMTGEATQSFQLIRFNPIGRVLVVMQRFKEPPTSFQLIRFNPIGRVIADANQGKKTNLKFPTNPI